MTSRFHLDQDVNKAPRSFLNAHYSDPDGAKAATELGLHLAFDGRHLLAASRAGRIFVTHNGKDFITIHDAWIHWSQAWGVSPMHAGNLIISQRWPPPIAAQEIIQFLGPRISLPNEIWGWDNDVNQWVQNPVPKRR